MPENGAAHVSEKPRQPSAWRISATFGQRASVASAQIEALLGVLDSTSDATERASLLVDIAIRFRDDLGDRNQAVEALLEAWSEDPTVESVLEALEPLVRDTGRWAEVLETTRTLAGGAGATKNAIAYAEAMVRWLTRDVPDATLARQWLERIRSLV